MRVIVVLLIFFFTATTIQAAEHNKPFKQLFEKLKKKNIVKKYSAKLKYKKLERKCFQRDNRKQSIRYCTLALKYKLSKRKNAELFNMRGTHKYMLKQYSAALKDYKKSSKYVPNSANNLHDIGIVLETTGDYKGAFEAYSHALRINPNFERAHYRLGVVVKLAKDTNPQSEYYENEPGDGELNEFDNLYGPTETKYGWCTHWNNRNFIKDSKCKVEKVCFVAEEGECEVLLTKSNDDKNLLILVEGTIDSLDGVAAEADHTEFGKCIYTDKNNKTLCFTDKQIPYEDKQYLRSIFAKMQEDQEDDERELKDAPYANLADNHNEKTTSNDGMVHPQQSNPAILSRCLADSQLYGFKTVSRKNKTCATELHICIRDTVPNRSCVDYLNKWNQVSPETMLPGYFRVINKKPKPHKSNVVRKAEPKRQSEIKTERNVDPESGLTAFQKRLLRNTLAASCRKAVDGYKSAEHFASAVFKMIANQSSQNNKMLAFCRYGKPLVVNHKVCLTPSTLGKLQNMRSQFGC